MIKLGGFLYHTCSCAYLYEGVSRYVLPELLNLACTSAASIATISLVHAKFMVAIDAALVHKQPRPVSTVSKCAYAQQQPIVRRRILSET